ncbi:site-specific integrase [Bradyrhizobium guangzhouense]|uniref:site-specific integrase n=1 Tax=Bradyrhizobium guangzhouense TaxID=1325095 RepID=UPI001009B9D6|nr:site-specific integrase [Bradyrhizobium guangzhouense]RXH15237.1 site-specific integrase [Bradyrhizobium guangzhouense]
MAKRSHGEGSIEERDGILRLRYRINGKKQSVTLPEGTTRKEARTKLTELLDARNKGNAVKSSKLTVAAWFERWVSLGCPGRRRERVSQRTSERYEELLRLHVTPKVGDKPLQKLAATDIDDVYGGLQGAIAPRTARHVHSVFNASLGTALRTGLIAANPMERVVRIPRPDAKPQAADLADDMEGDDVEDIDDHAAGLTGAELAALVEGFKPSPLYPLVALAAATGARRNELLALRWSDLDVSKKTLAIRRALDRSAPNPKKGIKLGLKPPKTARGRRAIDIDDSTLGLLLAVKQKHQRLLSGIPDGVEVDLSLIKLPPKALIFPAAPEPGRDFSLTEFRIPRNVSKEFRRRADLLGFGIKLHTLRGIHATALLDAGVPVDIVAGRIGDDPAVLLRNYSKRKRSNEAQEKVNSTLTALAASFLKP